MSKPLEYIIAEDNDFGPRWTTLTSYDMSRAGRSMNCYTYIKPEMPRSESSQEADSQIRPPGYNRWVGALRLPMRLHAAAVLPLRAITSRLATCF